MNKKEIKKIFGKANRFHYKKTKEPSQRLMNYLEIKYPGVSSRISLLEEGKCYRSEYNVNFSQSYYLAGAVDLERMERMEAFLLDGFIEVTKVEWKMK